MIVCTGLCAGYGQRAVLHHVDFCAKAGEFVAVLGPNGSGKTTLLRVLSGGLPLREGAVQLCGNDLHSLHPKERAHCVAVVPQRVESLPPVLARELVLLGRYPYVSWLGVYRSQDYVAVAAALEAVGAESLAQRQVRELSGGELQRVLLARALAQDTPVLLLDELTAGLDLARMVDLFDVLDSRRRAGVCVVAVMHDVNLAALYATRLVGLKDGSLRFDGAVDQVFTEETLRDLYHIPIHVFPHPVEAVPQACPGRRPLVGAAAREPVPDPASDLVPGAAVSAEYGSASAGGHQRH